MTVSGRHLLDGANEICGGVQSDAGDQRFLITPDHHCTAGASAELKGALTSQTPSRLRVRCSATTSAPHCTVPGCLVGSTTTRLRPRRQPRRHRHERRSALQAHASGAFKESGIRDTDNPRRRSHEAGALTCDVHPSVHHGETRARTPPHLTKLPQTTSGACERAVYEQQFKAPPGRLATTAPHDGSHVTATDGHQMRQHTANHSVFFLFLRWDQG